MMQGAFRRLHARQGSVRVLSDDAPGDGDRRELLRSIAVCGASMPAYLAATQLLASTAARAQTVPRASADDPEPLSAESEIRIVRDFTDPYLELLRLLRDATEIEHALMLQYLYSAFSLKPAYKDLVGYGDPNATTLLGVAIQEMEHLAVVNEFLVALGGAPNLMPQEFPFEPDIYPFAFNLEPLSHRSLATYVFAEAPPGVLDWQAPKGEDVPFVQAVWSLLGPKAKVNHLGSLYSRMIAMAGEVQALKMPGIPDMAPWIAKLHAVMEQGEVDHYEFFRGVFMGTHPAFKGRKDLWDLPPLDPDYPAMALETNPSAYVGHQRQIRNPTALSLAWLGNLHYWIILCLLNLHFRERSGALLALAEGHMQGPLWALGRYLPSLGVGLPFDPLATGYAPGVDPANRRFISHLLDEAERLEAKLAATLPPDFPKGTIGRTKQALDGEAGAVKRAG